MIESPGEAKRVDEFTKERAETVGQCEGRGESTKQPVKKAKVGSLGNQGRCGAWRSVCHNDDVKKRGWPLTNNSANPLNPRDTVKGREDYVRHSPCLDTCDRRRAEEE